MRISVVGAGYVGLVTGAFFAAKGHHVVLVDVDGAKVQKVNRGKAPFYEPGLEDLLKEGLKKGNLRATTDLFEAVADTQVSFVCVGTPSRADGSIDLSFVENAAKGIGRASREKNDFHVTVEKSTCVPGTADTVLGPALEKSSQKRLGLHLGLAVNPEFLREGSAVKDAFHPDRVVIGANDPKSMEAVARLYKGARCPFVKTDLRTAEAIKYVSNAFLATKIAYANEIANVASALGIDVYEVMKGVGLDNRISPHFLNAGVGFGGSCFPKDVAALQSVAKSHGAKSKILEAVLESNDDQPLRAVDLAEEVLGNLDGKRVALLGLAFKPETDDVRYSRAFPIAEALAKRKAKVVAYDPKGMPNFREAARTMKLKLEYARTAEDALTGADVAIVQSDWKEFRRLTPKQLKQWMRAPVIVDGRRTFDPEKLAKAGIVYRGIGWRNGSVVRRFA